MAKTFPDIASFSSFLLEASGRAKSTHSRQALRSAATIVWRKARRAIGRDNWEPGPPFVSPWPDLAESTQQEKERLGYTGQVSEYDSLLRTGAVRDSIKWKIHPDNKGFSVGSDNKVAMMLELGTHKMPPRSFLGGALASNGKRLAAKFGESLHTALKGEQVHQGSIDIEGEDH